MTVARELKQQQCASCRFFKNQPANLESSIVGLRVMGSGHSSVVSNDGLCARLDRYLSGNYSCGQYESSP